MKSRTTAQFRKLFAQLREQVQQQARAAYRQFQKDPNYPSLRFKKVHPELPIYSARINKNCRTVGQIDGEYQFNQHWKDLDGLQGFQQHLGKILTQIS